MRSAALAVLALLAACSKEPDYVEYRDAQGAFTTMAPEGWTPEVVGPFPEWPARKTVWVGAVADEHEGQPIGALYTIWRMDRHPTGKQARYRDEMLAATDALFADEAPADVMVAPGEVDGHPARAFQRDLVENLGGGVHGAVRTYPSRISGVAIQTPDAYYVLEYRATLELFEKHLPVFQRMREGFRPGK